MLDWWYELKEWWIDDVPYGFKDWLAFVGKGMSIVFLILFILFALFLFIGSLGMGNYWLAVIIFIVGLIIIFSMLYFLMEVFW